MKKLSFAGLAVVMAMALSPAAVPVPAAAADLTVGTWGIPPGKGNPYTGIGTPSIFTWDAIFDPLVRINAAGTATPILAESWKNIDPTHWEFRLREDIKFSNGEAFSADAVVNAFDYLKSEAGKATAVGRELSGVKAVEKKSEYSVEIETSGPDPVLPNKMALVYMVAPGAWKSLGPDGFADEPVGTGSFKLDSWTTNSAVLSANADSWRAPKVNSLEVISLPERAARLQALLSGQINVGFGFSPDNVGQMESAGMKVEVTPAPQVMSLAFANVQHPDSPFNDFRVREAANLAVNRKAIADVLLAGKGAPAGQGSTPAAFGYDPNIPPYPTDPAKAKQLLADAGYPDGFKAAADVVVGSFPADSEIYQQAAQDLKAVGIDVELRQITFPEWLQYFLKGTWPGEMFGSSWNTSPYMDSIRPYTYMSCMKANPFFCDESMTPFVDATFKEFDPARRAELLHKLHETTNEVLPAIWLVDQIDLQAYSPKVSGLGYANRVVYYENVTVSK